MYVYTYIYIIIIQMKVLYIYIYIYIYSPDIRGDDESARKARRKMPELCLVKFPTTTKHINNIRSSNTNKQAT